MALTYKPIITDVGVSHAISVNNDGLNFKITHVSFGGTKFNPTGKEISVKDERLKVEISSSARVNENTFKIRCRARSKVPFYCQSIGFWSDNTLFAIYSSTELPATGLFNIHNSTDTVVAYSLALNKLDANKYEVVLNADEDHLLEIIALHEDDENAHGIRGLRDLVNTKIGNEKKSNAVDSISQDTIATSLAVKKVNDEVKKKANISGQTFNGDVLVKAPIARLGVETDTGNSRLAFVSVGGVDDPYLYIRRDGEKEGIRIQLPKVAGELLVDTNLSSEINSSSTTKIANSLAVKNLNDKVDLNDSLAFKYKQNITGKFSLKNLVDGNYLLFQAVCEEDPILTDGNLIISSNLDYKDRPNATFGGNNRNIIFYRWSDGDMYVGYLRENKLIKKMTKVVISSDISSDINSSSTTKIANSLAVKTVNDKVKTNTTAIGKAQAKADSAYSLASTKEDKITRSSAIDSSSTTNVATSKAVKTVNDEVKKKANISGQTFNGDVLVKAPIARLGVETDLGKSYVKFINVGGIENPYLSIKRGTDEKSFHVQFPKVAGELLIDTNLSSDIDSSSTTKIANSLAVKTVNDKVKTNTTAIGKAQAKADSAYSLASTKEDKITRSSAIDSSSTTNVATSKAVKTVNDKVDSNTKTISEVKKVSDSNAKALDLKANISSQTFNGDVLVKAPIARLGIETDTGKSYVKFINVGGIENPYLAVKRGTDEKSFQVQLPKVAGELLIDTNLSSDIDSSSTTKIANSLAVKNLNDKVDLNDSLAFKYKQNITGKFSLKNLVDGNYLLFQAVCEEDPILTDGNLIISSNLDYKDRPNATFGGNNRNIIFYRWSDGGMYVGYLRENKLIKKMTKVIMKGDVDTVAVGSIHKFASDKSQKGYLKCDGGLYSTTTYADLFAEIGYTWGGSGNKFAVPKVTDKNRFFRSDGNGLKVGTYQDDAIRNIKGVIDSTSATPELSCFEYVKGDGAFKMIAGKKYAINHSTISQNQPSGFDFDASRVVPTSTENRPYSAVVAYWIKY